MGCPCSPIASLAAQAGPLGNVLAKTITRNGLGSGSWAQNFGYNEPSGQSNNRLTSASETGGNSYTYGYDAVGNRWVSGPNLTLETPTAQSWYIAGSPGTTSNRINSWGYDAAGNVTSVSGMTRSFTFDAENRLVTATVNSEQTLYGYDGDGKRVTKLVCPTTATCTSSTSGAVLTTYVYDLQGELAQEYGGSSSTAQTLYPVQDELGSVRLVTDGNGNPLECYDYLPFGETLAAGTNGRSGCYDAASNPPSTPDILSQKFTGKERDAETGLDYFGARYLSSAQGRWTSPDWSPNPEPVPYADLTDPQTLNLYGYVRNNPLASRDPDGHQCIPCLVQEGQAVLAEATPYINRAGAFLAAKGDTIVKAAIVLGGAALAGLESTANSCGGGVGCMATPPEILEMQRKEQGRDAQGKFTGKNEGESAPGKDEEARGSDALGATKNTKPLAGSNRIPDGTITATGQAVEIKSGGTVSNTKQIREMSAAAAKATGQPLVIGTTNPNVRVAGTVSQNPNVVVKPIPPPKQPNQ